MPWSFCPFAADAIVRGSATVEYLTLTHAPSRYKGWRDGMPRDLDWSGFLKSNSYTTLVIALVAYPEQPASETWVLDLGESGIEADELATQVLDFAHELHYGIPLSLDIKRNYFSWGAASSSLELLLQISEAVLSGVATDVIVRKIESLHRKLQGPEWPEPIDSELSRKPKTGKAANGRWT
jgi:hypothetical protein